LFALLYVYAGPRTGNKDGKIEMKSLVLTRMKRKRIRIYTSYKSKKQCSGVKC
jgi:hypothetical protein